MNNSPTKIGERTEAILLAELIKKGYSILIPFGNSERFDLVISHEDGTFEKIQCKTGQLRNGVVKFSTRSYRLNTKQRISEGYKGQIDTFAVYCPDNEESYMIPVDEVGEHFGTLRISPSKNNQIRGIRLADSYKL